MRSDGVELTLALAPRIAPLLAQRIDGLAERTPADLTFGNLWLFRRAHQWRWHDGPWPCLSGVTYDGQRSALPLFDLRHATKDVVRTLVDRHGALFPLCEREAEAVVDAGFELANHRDDADYVYRAQEFRSYRGRALRKKANLMAQLLAAHRLDVEPYGAHLHDTAVGVLEGWMQDKGKAPGDADEAACKDALGLAPELRLRGFLYRADGQPAGFLLAEPLQEGVWAIRFAKGLARFKGIAQYMFHHFASSGSSGNGPTVDWLNFEQDLGLANFRHTKMSYRPAFLLPKWRLLHLTA
ncbi:conserved hypothetical protein [Paraburkholderia unamae]|uniref:phosphatidylglycerol lysyltransferase domain-containing protein n=1 Tax=Paraburkholderia unamae TaxID=219649 RepID=UPI001CB5DC60|nr:phosphatidylglycerol lysyltransferase domain-containing protein [Paraburkholderia unamae]CAG9271547.1 conserved hypothetical protein [Paraburkholderia unamae]